MNNIYPHLTKRRAKLVKLLEEAFYLLGECDTMLLQTTNPRKRLNLRDTQDDIRKLVNEFEAEFETLQANLEEITAKNLQLSNQGPSRLITWRNRLIEQLEQGYDFLGRCDDKRLKSDDPIEQVRLDMYRSRLHNDINKYRDQLTSLDKRLIQLS